MGLLSRERLLAFLRPRFCQLIAIDAPRPVVQAALRGVGFERQDI